MHVPSSPSHVRTHSGILSQWKRNLLTTETGDGSDTEDDQEDDDHDDNNNDDDDDDDSA